MKYDVNVRTNYNTGDYDTFPIDAPDLETAQKDAMIEAVERGYEIDDVIDVVESTVMTKEQAIQIIRKNNNYTQAYFEMIDNGADENEAGVYWDEYQNQCGLDWKDPMQLD